MSELNGNEKYADLPTTMPTAARNPGPIVAGDLMLYGSRTLVMWYEDYSTSYTYTRIGLIEDAGGLAAAVGQGGVAVGFAAATNSTATSTATATDEASATPSSNAPSRVGLSSSGRKVWLLTSFLCLAYVLNC